MQIGKSIGGVPDDGFGKRTYRHRVSVVMLQPNSKRVPVLRFVGDSVRQTFQPSIHLSKALQLRVHHPFKRNDLFRIGKSFGQLLRQTYGFE